MKKPTLKYLITICISIAATYTGCQFLQPAIDHELPSYQTVTETSNQPTSFDLSQIPDYTGSPYVIVNNNIPFFTDDQLVTESYETYAPLDHLNRCGPAIACINKDLMPTEKRTAIGSVKPTGWHTVKYPEQISDNYLYNRCHLIGYQLTGENANEQNLITGTRYLNVEGMMPFENQTADYIQDTNNHVLYRVTPTFVNDELIARGVLMEALSVEDQGQGLQFCIYVYNVQPEIDIDYQTGDSWIDTDVR